MGARRGRNRGVKIKLKILSHLKNRFAALGKCPHITVPRSVRLWHDCSSSCLPGPRRLGPCHGQPAPPRTDAAEEHNWIIRQCRASEAPAGHPATTATLIIPGEPRQAAEVDAHSLSCETDNVLWGKARWILLLELISPPELRRLQLLVVSGDSISNLA